MLIKQKSLGERSFWCVGFCCVFVVICGLCGTSTRLSRSRLSTNPDRPRSLSYHRAPYINVLPSSQEVNPTLIWSDEDMALLDNSPLVAATRSLRRKLEVRSVKSPARLRESTGL